MNQQRHIREICFLKLKSFLNVILGLGTVSDGVMPWIRMFIGKNWVSLLRCIEVPIMMKSLLLELSLSLLIVIQPEVSFWQSHSCIREISISALDKYMYTWVSSAYKWRYTLWIRKLSGVVYRKHSLGDDYKTKLMALKNSFLFVLIENGLRSVLCLYAIPIREAI